MTEKDLTEITIQSTSENHSEKQSNSKKITALLPIILNDKGKTDIYELAKQVGFDEHESKTEVPFLIYSLAKIIKNKSNEMRADVMTRGELRDNLSIIYSKIMQKLVDDTKGENFTISDKFRADLRSVLEFQETYAKFEGLNKPDKLEIEISQRIDTDKLTDEEAEQLITNYQKSVIDRDD
jgi:hypothetical protein